MAKAAGRTARAGVTLRCSECGWQTAKWVGRCGECQAWGTVGEPGGTPGRTTVPGPVTAPAQRIPDVDAELDPDARPTGSTSSTACSAAGWCPAACVLLAGEPGVGKSTLLLEVAARYASPATPTLYVTGEESAGQVRLRAGRTGALDPHLYLAAETDLAAILGHIEAVQPSLLVVDSVQTIASAEVDGTAGGVTQVREVAASLIRVAKTKGIATVLVGHVTKDGSIAGPRLLEHLVDVVLSFEGDRHSTLRMVRATKNRFGPADEVGCFELDDDGIRGLADPSGLFLSSALSSMVPGTCVTVAARGTPTAVRRGAGPGRALPGGQPAAGDRRTRRLTGRADARRPPAALRHPPRPDRGLRLHRRRGPHHRAGGRPRGRPGARLRRRGASRARRAGRDRRGRAGR